MRKMMLVLLIQIMVLVLVPQATMAHGGSITPAMCTDLADYNAKAAHHTWSAVASRTVSIALQAGTYAYGAPRYPADLQPIMYFGDLIAWAYIAECARWAIVIWRNGRWVTHFLPERGLAYITEQVNALNNGRLKLMRAGQASLLSAGANGFAVRIPVAVAATEASRAAAAPRTAGAPIIVVAPDKFCVVRVRGKCVLTLMGTAGVEME